MARRTLPRLLRISLLSLAGLVALVIIGGVVVALSFDPDSLKPRIIAAVKQSTGRDLTLQGRIRLGLSLQPTLTVQGVAFANPAGFSRPQMATLEQLDLKLALIPLLSHRVEIDRLVLVKPDIILETDAQGRPNWQFTPASNPPASPSAATATNGQDANGQDGAATNISVADVRIENGTVTWRDDRAGRSAVLGVASLRASAPSPDANLELSMSANYNGTPLTLAGEFGPLTQLRDRQASAAWPVRARLEAVGARLTVDGTVAQPVEGHGYRMTLSANVSDMAALAPFMPGTKLPPLRDLSFAAQVADTGGALPELSGLTLHVGQSDLTGVVAGLRVEKLDVTAARFDQPIQISAQGYFNNTPATLTGSLGAPAALLAGTKAAAPIPLDLTMQALGSSLAVKGTAARGQDGRPSVQAVATSDKIDLDALLAALAKPPAGPVATAPAAPAAPTAKPAASGRLIPDTPIPFDLLRHADAEVKLSVGQLVVGGAIYRSIATHIDLHGGKLRLDPLTGDLPEGHLNAALSADATQTPPAVAVRVQIPALALQPLLVAMKEPAVITGNMQVQADLHGNGATPHAIAATIGGSLGVAMANGTVDNRLLGGTLGSILRQINLLDLVGRGGMSQVQCFAARLDASNGIATVRSLVLASSLLTMDGSGSLNLGAETLDLRVRPQAKVAGTGVVVPLRISGPFRSPAAAPDAGAEITENAGTVAGALLGNTNALGLAAGALGAKQLFGGVTIDCGAALAGVRGAPGATAPAAPAAQPAPQQQPKPPNIGGMLKQLFR
jgi:AsmA protein